MFDLEFNVWYSSTYPNGIDYDYFLDEGKDVIILSLNKNRFGVYRYTKDEFEREASTKKENSSLKKSLNKNLIKGLFGEFEDYKSEYQEKLNILGGI